MRVYELESIHRGVYFVLFWYPSVDNNLSFSFLFRACKLTLYLPNTDVYELKSLHRGLYFDLEFRYLSGHNYFTFQFHVPCVSRYRQNPNPATPNLA